PPRHERGLGHQGHRAADALPRDRPGVGRASQRPEAAGLLASTLVVWGGEFGRTPMNEERGGSKFLGRDHHPHAFTMWLAGGGIKAGQTIGRTDDFAYRIVEEATPVHDLHATVLRLMGIDHTKLTYRFLGRDYRLPTVEGCVTST